jgi:hypothetical protein
MPIRADQVIDLAIGILAFIGFMSIFVALFCEHDRGA